MNIKQSMKLRYLTYRLFYLAFILLNYLIAGFLILVLKDPSKYAEHITVGGIAAAFLFSFLLGIYEYRALYPKYFNLNNIRRAFYWGSLLGNLINSLILVINFLIFNIFLSSLIAREFVFSLPYKATTYILICETLWLVFVSANVLTKLLGKVVVLIKIALLAGIGLFGYYLSEIISFWNDRIIPFISGMNADVRVLLVIVGVVSGIYLAFYEFVFTRKK